MAQNEKKFCLSCFISQEPYITWLSFVVHKFKKMISPCIFFVLLKFWFFGLLVGEKGENGAKWQKILFVTLHISYILWLSFVIRKCKMITSPGFLKFFSKFWFFGLLGESKSKKWPKMKKKLCCTAPYISGIIHHMILIYGTHV